MICNNCGKTFDTPCNKIDYVDEGEGYPYSVCPYCESEDIEDSHSCPICSFEIPKSLDYCERHIEEVWGELFAIWDYYDRSDAAKQIMSDWIDFI